jgi:hypothetical protein
MFAMEQGRLTMYYQGIGDAPPNENGETNVFVRNGFITINGTIFKIEDILTLARVLEQAPLVEKKK